MFITTLAGSFKNKTLIHLMFKIQREIYFERNVPSHIVNAVVRPWVGWVKLKILKPA